MKICIVVFEHSIIQIVTLICYHVTFNVILCSEFLSGFIIFSKYATVNTFYLSNCAWRKLKKYQSECHQPIDCIL